jgi:hypothetical protein
LPFFRLSVHAPDKEVRVGVAVREAAIDQEEKGER